MTCTRRQGLLRLAAAGFVLHASALHAQAARQWLQRLQDGRHLLLMRHAEAPGIGDPDGWRIGDCKSQRNLSEPGREQARAVGRWLRDQGVQSATVSSSPWCRCMDTARLMEVGPVTEREELGSFFEQSDRAPAQTERLQRYVATSLRNASARQPLLLVSHQVNIQAYCGRSLASGALVLVRTGVDGRALEVSELRR